MSKEYKIVNTPLIRKEYEKKNLDKRIRKSKKSKNQKNTEYEKIQSRRGVFCIHLRFYAVNA